MEPNRRFTPTKSFVVALWLLTLTFSFFAIADEREQLVAITRQLDLADRLADQAATTASSTERTRYHFDYARLREDLQRVRAGISDYLAPQRAQPRDPAPLADSYTRETGSDAQVRLP